MAQRLYWVPHTLCFLGCAHCHNDSAPGGERARPELFDRLVTHLPGPDSAYRLGDVVIGGGEGLMRQAETEHLIRQLRRRFPAAPGDSVAARRSAGQVIIALQTTGLPLADGRGRVRPDLVEHWLELGVDYFQVASSDIFHRRARPDYPWAALEAALLAHGQERGVEFMIYGKEVRRLVPSGRVLDNLATLEAEGAALLTAPHYCADGWETASRFLSGTASPYPDCSEVVIDPQGWVHPCCWYLLSPGLFNLNKVPFAEGMDALADVPFCQALDRGDILGLAQLAGVASELAATVRDTVGDCGACRLLGLLLVAQGNLAWMRVAPLSARERRFYAERLGDILNVLDPGAS